MELLEQMELLEIPEKIQKLFQIHVLTIQYCTIMMVIKALIRPSFNTFKVIRSVIHHTIYVYVHFDS